MRHVTWTLLLCAIWGIAVFIAAILGSCISAQAASPSPTPTPIYQLIKWRTNKISRNVEAYSYGGTSYEYDRIKNQIIITSVVRTKYAGKLKKLEPNITIIPYPYPSPTTTATVKK